MTEKEFSFSEERKDEPLQLPYTMNLRLDLASRLYAVDNIRDFKEALGLADRLIELEKETRK